MTVYAITDTKKREQGLRLLIFILPEFCISERLTGNSFYVFNPCQVINWFGVLTVWRVGRALVVNCVVRKIRPKIVPQTLK